MNPSDKRASFLPRTAQEFINYVLLSNNHKTATNIQKICKICYICKKCNHMKIIKRDNTVVDFNIQKIYKAVDAAFVDTTGSPAPDSLHLHIKETFDSMPDERVMHIEEVQDYIEDILMDRRYHAVAREYILYRSKHSEERLIHERIKYMDSYAASGDNAATSSETDANANVIIKNVANLNGEVYKTVNRKVQRYRMRKKLKQMFPEVERQYEYDLENHIIYTHDESSTPVVENYCEAVTMYPFYQYGTSTLDGTAATAPKNMSSFAGQFVNCVFLLAAQCKGAVAFGEFFNAYDYYCVQDFGSDYHLRTDELATIYPRKTIGEVIDQYFQQIVYTINQPSGNRNYQSPFTNVSYYDSNYWHALFDEFVFPDGSKPEWERISFLQKRFMKWLNNERTKTMLTFPVETMALLSDGKDIMDQEYKVFTAEMYAEGHSFFTYISDNPNALASCCRLRNEMTDNVFTFTNGLTGVQTGSANVITLNMNRIVQNWASEGCYTRKRLAELFTGDNNDSEYDRNMRLMAMNSLMTYLTVILERVYKYHKAYKTLLYEVEEQGLLTASNAGYISMSRLYSTIGINGINEAAEFAGLKCSYNEEYKRFCRLITGIISRNNKEHSKDKAFLFNQEFVPAEGLSSKNYRWDKADGYWVPEDRVLYNSYFYLADDPDTSVLDKFRLHGREFTELLDGGVGLHCNLEEHLSKIQYLKLIDFAIANGTTYFTFNIPNSECSNPKCHHIIKTPLDVCPKCGAPMRLWTRIIGYMRPLDNYDYFRKIEAMKRHYAKSNSF